MRVLLDECIDRRFAKSITGHTVKSVSQIGWSSLKNGELLKKAESNFDVFVTVDRGLSQQQNISNKDIAVIVLCAKTNRLVDLLPLTARLLMVLPQMRPG